MKIIKCFPAILALSAPLVLSGCVEDKVEDVVNQTKYEIDKAFTGITGGALRAAIEIKEYNCVVIDIRAYGNEHQQIAVRKKNLDDNEFCSVPPQDDAMPSTTQPEQ